MTWNPAQYLKFSEERSRPFLDLLARVPLENPRFIADLGCGPGNLTRSLLDRWPLAQIVGVDSSPEMLAQAQSAAGHGRLTFIQADLATWSPDQPLDLIISNAALQWVGGHEQLLARLVGLLASAGVLAVQIPYHRGDSAHAIIQQTVESPRWSGLLQGLRDPQPVLPMQRYAERLHDLGMTVDLWQTTYLHVLQGENTVLEWFKGTALRPLLVRLSESDQTEFLADLGNLFRAAYPPRHGLTLLPFPRLFFVATHAQPNQTM